MRVAQVQHSSWRTLRRTVGSIAAVLFVTALIGTLIGVLFLSRLNSGTASNVQLQGNKPVNITVITGKTVTGSASGIYITALKDTQGKVVIQKLDPQTHKALWSADVAVPNPAITVVGDTVYVSSSDEGAMAEKYVIALNAVDGTERWRATFPASIFEGKNRDNNSTYSLDLGYLTTPVVTNGTVYVIARNGMVFALDAKTGEPLWHHDTNELGVVNGTIYDPGRLAVANGTVYGTIHNTYFALDAKSGRQLWSRKAPLPKGVSDQVLNTPVVVNGVVYISSYEPSHHTAHQAKGSVSAFNAGDGKLRWQFPVNDGVMDAVNVVDGMVYFGADDHNVYALNAATGEKQWSWDSHGRVFDMPLVVDGVVYVTQMGNANEAKNSSSTVAPTVFALDAKSGQLQWTQARSANVVAVQDGVLYASVFPNQVLALDTNNGKQLWIETYGVKVTDKMGQESGITPVITVIP